MTLKVMGRAEQPVAEALLDVINRHSVPHNIDSLTTRQSSKGNFNSISLEIEMENKDQVESVYHDLSERPEISAIL